MSRKEYRFSSLARGSVVPLILAMVVAACGGGTTQETTPGAGVSPSTGPAPLGSSSATLSWSNNTETDLAGYRVYYGTAPGAYTQPKGQGIVVTATNYTITGLSSGVRYYFAVTAFDNSSNESGYSQEVFKDIP